MISFMQGFVYASVLLGAACEDSPSSPKMKRSPQHAVQEGRATYNGNEFEGQKTANGEKLKLGDMTAASRTLPLGTRAEVTNKETGQTATVRINDRGPYVADRVIDLTPKAAKHIGIDLEEGVAPVTVKPVSPETASDAHP